MIQTRLFDDAENIPVAAMRASLMASGTQIGGFRLGATQACKVFRVWRVRLLCRSRFLVLLAHVAPLHLLLLLLFSLLFFLPFFEGLWSATRHALS
jgi:hypothetical protein